MSHESSIGLRANRTLSKRAKELDAQEKILEKILGDEQGEVSASDDDETYGAARATKAAGKRKRSAVLQVLTQQSLQPVPPPLSADRDSMEVLHDEDFLPLNDLKGASQSNVAGRRITVWYKPDASELDGSEPDDGTLNPTHGLVTYYGEEGRLFVVFDGEEEFDGWWVDGNDEWQWADEAEVGPAPRALPVPCLLYTSPSPRDGLLSRMPSSA